MKLAEISIKRPSLVIVLFTILTLGGLFSYTLLGYELIPKFDTNAITIVLPLIPVHRLVKWRIR